MAFLRNSRKFGTCVFTPHPHTSNVSRGNTNQGEERVVPALTLSLPPSPIEPVTEVLHGVPVVDPYRWLEDQNAPRTQKWIDAQTRYARAHLDSIPGRERIRERIREFLAIETYDSLQRV